MLIDASRGALLASRSTLDPYSGESCTIRDVTDDERLQIGEFADLVGLSVPQLRRFDRLGLLEPNERSSESRYRYYGRGQIGAARVIALLRSTDMPIAEIGRILAGASENERQEILQVHKLRLEARLDEVRGLLDAVEKLSKEDIPMTTSTELSEWLHLMPQLPVRDMERSIAYYEEALGFRLSWRTVDGRLAAMASREIETLFLVPWTSNETPPPMSAYVYVDDPDALCAEYLAAGADIIDPVASRSYGMRDFKVRDLDGHCFTLGKGEERLRDIADRYGLTPEEIAVDPSWLKRRRSV